MKQTTVSARAPRMDRLIREHVHDPYKTRLKLPEPTVCPQCGAVYHRGRWQWGEPPAQADREHCQACHRISDAYPAGIVTLSGAYLDRHKLELLALTLNQEELEMAEHPLHRIMDVEEGEDQIVIRTTDIHLPRRVGEALRRAYQGDLEYHYEEGTYFIRIDWQRDD